MNDSSPSLGKLLLEIQPGKTFFQFVLGGGFLFFICGLMNLAVNLSQAEARADAIVGGGFLLLGLLAVSWGYRKVVLRPTSLIAYEQGIVKVRNDKKTTVLWDEVQYLFRTEVSMEQNKTRGFGLQLRTLTTWRLLDIHEKEVSLESFSQMGAVAEERVLPRLKQEFEAVVNAGETAVFGPVSVNHVGIQHGDEQYPWSDIYLIEFDRHILLHLPRDRKRNWREAYVVTIPNLPILEQFIDEKIASS